MDNQPEVNINQPVKTKKPLEYGLAMAIVIIFVVAAGVALYWIGTEPIEQPEPLINNSKSSDQSAGWKIYRNEEYGFEVKYPLFGQQQKIEVKNYNNYKSINFLYWSAEVNNFIDEFSFSIAENNQKLSLKDWFGKNVDINNILTNNNNYDFKTILNGEGAILSQQPIPVVYLNAGGPVAEAYLMPSSLRYVIIFSWSQVNDFDLYGYKSPELLQVLQNQILSTFKFTK